jgi:hypothetical protein
VPSGIQDREVRTRRCDRSTDPRVLAGRMVVPPTIIALANQNVAPAWPAFIVSKLLIYIVWIYCREDIVGSGGCDTTTLPFLSRPQSELNIFTVETYGRGFSPSMKSRYPFEEERCRSLLDIDAAEKATAEFASSLLSSDGTTIYLLDRRKQFFRNTIFSLGEKT